MKKNNRLLLAALMLAHSSAHAVTPLEGWYGGFMVGGSFIPKIEFIVANNPFTLSNPIIPGPYYPNIDRVLNNQVTYHVGMDGGGQVGYRYCNFRFEGQLLYSWNPVGSLNINGNVFKRYQRQTGLNLINNPSYLPYYPSISGNTNLGAGIFNVFYDFYNEDDDPSFIPYLGLGIGYGQTINRLSYSYPHDINTINPFSEVQYSWTYKLNKGTPVGQAILGAAYYYSDDVSYAIDYRYLTARTIRLINSRIQNHSINFVFNYSFQNT